MSSRVLEPPRQQPTSPHPHVQSQFAAYLANDLVPSGQSRVAAHLRDCPACAAALVHFLQELRATTDLLGSLPVHHAPQALRERLLAISDEEMP